MLLRDLLAVEIELEHDRRLTPGVLPTLLAVMPLTIIDSSIQLRPCSGSSSICRRSTLPATCDDVMSTSGASPVTVSVSFSWASFIVEGDRGVLADEQLHPRAARPVEKPESSACTL